MTDKMKKTWLSLGSKSKIAIVVFVFMVALATSMISAFAADPVIIASGWTPAKGSTISTLTPNISLHVSAKVADLNSASVRAKIDGNAVTAKLQLQGHWETAYDTCSGSYEVWVQDNLREGTITFTSPVLSDGGHTVEVTVADNNNNSLTETWQFNVDGPPKFTNLTPALYSYIGNLTKITAVVTDPVGIDWNSVVVKLDGNVVQHKVDQASGTVTYDGVISDGNKTVYIEAKDVNGILGSTTWTFNNDSTKPVASNWSPAKDGQVSVANPKLSVNIADASSNLNESSLSVKIDGKAVAATLTYPGHMGTVYIDGEGDVDTWIIDSNREGTVSFTAPTLTDGVHEAEVNIADARGNLLNEKWSFTVYAPPTFSGMSPAAGTNQNNPAITAVISDNTAVDWGTVVMKINNTAVAAEVYQETGTVTYKGSYPSGTVNVYIEAKDTAGNLASKTWSFNNVVNGPQFKTCYYRTSSGGAAGTWWALTDGFTITNGILWFDGNIDDTVKITSVTATLNGVPLAIESTPPSYYVEGYYDDDPGYWEANDLRHVWYKYTGVVKDGEHTLVVTARDEVGITTSLTRKITVKSPPVISNMAPLQYGVTDLTPSISVDVKDPNGTLVPESVILTVDGVAVDRNYDATANKVTSQSGQLSDESYHTVTLSATDDFGLTATKTWKFYTNANNYPDMADSNINNCNTCHTNYTTLQSHPLTFSGSHSDEDRCQECHKYVSVVADCYQCHGNPDSDWEGYAPHGSSPSIGYSATNYDTSFPLRIKTNREMYDCVICHQPGAGTSGHVGYLVQPTRLLNNHDIPDLHKYTNDSCNKCHAQSLTREHARPGRLDQNGQAINCNTCHKSSNPKVLQAISTKNKDCVACHDTADHATIHITEMDTNCKTCHYPGNGQSTEANNLVGEHVGKADSNGAAMDCATCHASTRKDVKRTIAAGNINCSGCHIESKTHKVIFADKVPADIPLYTGFQWSTPMETSLFATEPGTPAGYDAGQMVLSNRRTDVLVDAIWQFYNSELTTKNGWVLKSGAPTADAQSFKAEFTKDNRAVTVNCFNTAHSDETGSLIGYKIEIWYK